MPIIHLAEELFKRDTDIVGEVKSAPDTFSSWDNCMQKSYCKWPVIIGIIVGSVIVISTVWCLVRCLCCGMSCCCSCLSCLNCCDCGKSRPRSKYTEVSPHHNPPNPYHGYIPPSAPPSYEPPRFAQFDASSKSSNPDSLPAMPSWDGASTKKVEDTGHEHDVEMDRLDHKNGGTASYNNQQPSANMDHPTSYRGNETTNPYANVSTAYGGAASSFPHNQPPPVHYGGGHDMEPRHDYERMSPNPAQGGYGGYGGYGLDHGMSSPYNDRIPSGDPYSNSYYNPQQQAHEPYSAAPTPRAHQDYSPYTPITPSASSPFADNRPPSLLQPGRRTPGQAF